MRRVQRSLATHPAHILEAGGIDRPMLGKSERYTYAGLDIDEKANCHEVYDELLVQSIESSVPGDYDLVISKILLEHVADNRAGNRASSEVPT